MAVLINTEEEIYQRFEDLMQHCVHCEKEEDRKLIREAFEFANLAHRDVKRKSGEPYIIHPLSVARIVTEEIGLGPTAIISALLHDVVEDTAFTLDDIRSRFGDKIASIVDGLTKISDVFDEESSLQAENFRKMLLSMTDDVRVILIKLADRLHNMRTLDSMPHNKQVKISGETIYLFAPLAHRLGLYNIKTELEDLSLKYRYPKIHEELQNKIVSREKTRSFYINNFIDPIKQKLDELNISYVFSEHPESIYGIWYRMQNENVSFEEVYDTLKIDIVFDPRIDIPEKNQCWNIYAILTDLYMPKPERIRDFVSKPQINGFEALQSTFMGPNGKWAELQIQTKRMNEIGQKGFVAYRTYDKKGTGEVTGELDKWIEKVKELLRNNDNSALDFLDDFKLNLFSSEILVFTPKGQMRTMPINATALDFAYEIHSGVGNKALAAKVNHRLVPLNYTLSSGDQVEILTSDKMKVKPEWIDLVMTAKAKSNIKKAVKVDSRDLIAKGRELFEKRLATHKTTESPELFKRLFQTFDLRSRDDLFRKLGSGFLRIEDMDKIIKIKPRSKFIRYWELQFAKTVLKNIREELLSGKKQELVFDESDEPKYKIANCCKPIPGDEVIGHVSPNDKVIVHKVNCPTAVKLLSRQANLVVPVKWITHNALSYLVRIQIQGIETPLIFASITTAISNEMKSKIRSINMDSHDGVFEGTLDMYVHDTKDLNNLIAVLMKINGIESVKRLEYKEE